MFFNTKSIRDTVRHPDQSIHLGLNRIIATVLTGVNDEHRDKATISVIVFGDRLIEPVVNTIGTKIDPANHAAPATVEITMAGVSPPYG